MAGSWGVTGSGRLAEDQELMSHAMERLLVDRDRVIAINEQRDVARHGPACFASIECIRRSGPLRRWCAAARAARMLSWSMLCYETNYKSAALRTWQAETVLLKNERLRGLAAGAISNSLEERRREVAAKERQYEAMEQWNHQVALEAATLRTGQSEWSAEVRLQDAGALRMDVGLRRAAGWLYGQFGVTRQVAVKNWMLNMAAAARADRFS